MKTIAYVGTNTTESNLIKSKLKDRFNVLDLDLNKVIIVFEKDRNLSVYYKYDSGFDYLSPDVFMSRSASNDFVCMIAKSIDSIYNTHKDSCSIIDGIDRFSVSSKSPKLNSIFQYWISNNYPTTLVSYSSGTTKEYLKFRYGEEFTKKLVYKPTSGSHGEGMQLISSWNDFSNNLKYYNGTLIFQEFIELESEYRVYLYSGKILAALSKKVEQEKSSKLFSGRRMELVELPYNVKEFIHEYPWRIGFIGADIGVSKEGNMFVFEQNRAPEFEQTNNRLIEANLPTIEQLLVEAIYEEKAGN